MATLRNLRALGAGEGRRPAGNSKGLRMRANWRGSYLFCYSGRQDTEEVIKAFSGFNDDCHGEERVTDLLVFGCCIYAEDPKP